jgi:hypothetical protein
MKKFIKEFFVWLAFVLFCAGVLVFIQDGLGYDLFTPIPLTIDLNKIL